MDRNTTYARDTTIDFYSNKASKLVINKDDIEIPLKYLQFVTQTSVKGKNLSYSQYFFFLLYCSLKSYPVITL